MNKIEDKTPEELQHLADKGRAVQKLEAALRLEPAKEEFCHAAKDGECEHWDKCPQKRDNEPSATGRGCPLRWYEYE